VMDFHHLLFAGFAGAPTINVRREFAVGTPIAERPPHSSERAQFGHSAPTSGA
jgi:hypothetical protein